MLPEIEGLAIQTLQEMDHAGQLHFPQPWINDRGEVHTSWDEDADGSVLACYLDMLGLNGREIRQSVTDSGMAARRRDKASGV